LGLTRNLTHAHPAIPRTGAEYPPLVVNNPLNKLLQKLKHALWLLIALCKH